MDIKKKKFIIAALRRSTYRWPPRYEAKNLARRGKQLNKNNRMVWMYECYICNQLFEDKQVQMDHIIPICGDEGFRNWDEFLDNILCDIPNWGVACKPCHKAKTKRENDARKALKKLKSTKSPTS